MPGPRRLRRLPVVGPLLDPATYLAVPHLLLDGVIGYLLWAGIGLGLLLALVLTPVLVGVPLLTFVMVLARMAGSAERLRVRYLLGHRVPEPLPLHRPDGLWATAKANLRDSTSWRVILYFWILSTTGLLYVAGVILWLPYTLMFLTAPWLEGALPDDPLVMRWLMDGGVGTILAGTAAGLALMVSFGYATRWMSAFDRRLATWLLGPSRKDERLRQLGAARAMTVNAEAAKLRRIERDLHDGAQARMVAVAMGLGIARDQLATDPAGARDTLDQTHTAAKQAVTELRELVQGVQPAVLTDRGLAAALRGLGTQYGFPVEVTVEVTDRPSPAIESIAYFAVAELLTNVAKHSGATQASAVLRRVGDQLRITVTDDGRGGADAATGSGLAGLRERVESVDGRMVLRSPAGGPTEIELELPCAL